MKQLLFLVFCLPFLSCTKTKENTPEPQEPGIASYRTVYMDYPASVMPSSNSPFNLVKLEYDGQGKVAKRWGGLLPIYWGTGYNFTFSEGLYEEILYQNNQTLISQKDTLKAINVYANWRLITYQNDKISTIVKQSNNLNATYDTTFFYYNGNTLAKTIKKGGYKITTKEFGFDAAGNLNQVKGLTKNRYSNDTINYQLETFSDFDNAKNPLKKLGIFDELFNRSLSQNNYRKYLLLQFNRNLTSSYNISNSWTFVYDQEGNIKFDE